jgi:hypothetical protein
MSKSRVQEYYAKVNDYWKQGLNPTLKIRVTPLEDNILPIFDYINFNKGDETSFIESSFFTSTIKEGSVQDSNFGYSGTFETTSESINSELFFEQCAIEVTKWIKESIKNDKYSIAMDILVDLPSKDIENFIADLPNIQIKTDGAGCVATAVDWC